MASLILWQRFCGFVCWHFDIFGSLFGYMLNFEGFIGVAGYRLTVTCELCEHRCKNEKTLIVCFLSKHHAGSFHKLALLTLRHSRLILDGVDELLKILSKRQIHKNEH